MKDMHTALRLTHEHLRALEAEIHQGAHEFQPGHFEKIISILSKDSNLLSKELHTMHEKAIQVDADLNYQLLATIDRIRHAHAFWMAIGSSQEALLNALKKIETSIRKWVPKVEKTEQHPM